MKKLFILFLVFAFAGTELSAAKRYWISATAGYWNNTLNWSTSSGGAGGASVPGANDTVYFDGGLLGTSADGNDTLDVNISVKRLEITNTYDGTIVQGTKTVTIGTSGATLSGGTFSGGSASITVSGAFTISGCAFTSTSGTFSTSSSFTVSSGSFTHNSGTLTLTATLTFTISNTGGTTFYDLTFAPTGANSTFTITSTSTITVSHTLIYGGTKAITPNSGTLHITGNISISNTINNIAGTAILIIDGTTGQTITGNGIAGGCFLSNLTINKSADTLKLLGTISVAGTLTNTAGIINAGTSSVIIGATTVSGSITLYNVTFYGQNIYTISSGTTITVSHTLVLGTGGLNPILNTGTIHAKGDVDYTTSTSTINGGGTATIIVNGSGTQTLKGSATTGAARLCNFQINKSATDTFKITNGIIELKNWTYTSGIVSAGSSTVQFVTSLTITGSHSLNNVTFNGGAVSTYTIASGTTLTVNGTLTLNGTNAITLNTGNIYAKGNISITNTAATSGGGNATLTINGTSNQTVTGPSSDNQGLLPNVVINKLSDTLKLSGHISVKGDWTYTSGIVSPGSSAVYFLSTKTISGSHTLFNVTIGANATETITIASGTTLTVAGTFWLGGGSLTVTLSTGTITAQGDITVTNTSTSTGGSATINITGTGNQTFTGSGTAGQGRLPKITIDKTGGTLSLASIISVAGNWIYNQGTVSPGTSQVIIYGTSNVDGQASGSSNTMPFYDFATGGTVTLTGNLNVDNTLNISSGTSLSAGSYSIDVGGKWNSQGTWTYSTSTVTFDGSGYKDIKGSAGATVNFYNLAFNRSSGSMALSNPVKVNNALTLTKGKVKSTSTNYLELADNATLTGGSDSSYVHGPMRKTGNDAFTFPLGDTALASGAYHSLAMTAPSVVTDQFEATYFAAKYTVGDSLVDSLASVSQVENWKLERKAGTSDVTLSLRWNSNSTSITDLNTLRIGNWNGTKWLDLGATNITVGNRTGIVTATVATSFNSNVAFLTFANKKISVPFALLKKKLDGGYYQAVNGQLFFRFDEEYNDADGKLSFNIYNDQHTLVTSDQMIGTLLQPAVAYGDNRYQLYMIQCDFAPSGILADGFYTLEITNEKNEKWYLRFKKTSTITLNNCFTLPNGN